MLSKIKYWIPLAVVVTALCGLVYVVGQQNLRQAANDPQIQISEDLAGQLGQKKLPTPQTAIEIIDISKSLSPFVIVYDDRGQAIASTARLNGKVPTLPKGVLEYTKVHKQDRITWEPQKGIRHAIVVTRVENGIKGYVLAGRSLREVEKREDMLLQQVGLSWIIILAVSLVAKIMLIETNKKK